MTLTFIPADTDFRREIIFLDGKIVGDITPNALDWKGRRDRGGFLHLFGPVAKAFPRVRARSWPQHCPTREEAHDLVREMLFA